MISEEEKQAIEYAKSLIELFDSGVPLNYLEQENDNLKLFLNLIEKLKKENKEKDKQIDLLCSKLSEVVIGIDSVIEQFEKEYCEFINSNEDCCWKTDMDCKDCIKQYFEKEAKKGE